MKIIQALIVFTLLSAVSPAEQTGFLQCLKEGNKYKMVLVVKIKDDPVTDMYATSAAGVKDNDCVTGVNKFIKEFGGTKPNAYWKVEVTFTDTTVTSSDDCGPVQDPNNNLKYTWYFATRQKPESHFSTLMFKGDMNYMASCDFASLTENLVLSANIDVSGETSKTITKTEESVTFKVYDAGFTQEVTSSQLGDIIALQMVLTPSADGATGISPYECKACDTTDCSGTAAYVLTTSEGCYVASQHIGTGGSASFTGTSPSDLKTTSFMNFVFNGASKKVYFICRIEFCYGDDTLQCKDRCTNKRRRKRDVAGDRDTNNVTSVTAVTINVGPEDSRVKTHDADPCEIHMVFLGVTISLAILLIASIVFSVKVYCMLNGGNRGDSLKPKLKP